MAMLGDRDQPPREAQCSFDEQQARPRWRWEPSQVIDLRLPARLQVHDRGGNARWANRADGSPTHSNASDLRHRGPFWSTARSPCVIHKAATATSQRGREITAGSGSPSSSIAGNYTVDIGSALTHQLMITRTLTGGTQ